MTYLRKTMAALLSVCLIGPVCVGPAAAQVQSVSVNPETGAAALGGQLQQTLNQAVATSWQQKLDFDAAASLTLEALQGVIVASGLAPLDVQRALLTVRASTRPSSSALETLKARVDATVVACYTPSQIEAARKGKADIQRGSCAAGLSVAAIGGTPGSLSAAPNFAGVSGGADYRSGQ